MIRDYNRSFQEIKYYKIHFGLWKILITIHCKLSRAYHAQNSKLSRVFYSFNRSHSAKIFAVVRQKLTEQKGYLHCIYIYIYMRKCSWDVRVHSISTHSIFLPSQRQQIFKTNLFVFSDLHLYVLVRKDTHAYASYTITTDLFTFRNGFISQYFALIATYR